MATMQERREAYRQQKAVFASQEATRIDAIKAGVMTQLCENFPGIELVWVATEERPLELRVYVRYEGKDYGARMLYPELFRQPEHVIIHWFCEALARHLMPRPSKTDYRQEADSLFTFIADNLERRFRNVQVMRRRDDPRDRLHVRVASGSDYIDGAFDALQLENWQETGKTFVAEATARLKETAQVA